MTWEAVPDEWGWGLLDESHHTLWQHGYEVGSLLTVPRRVSITGVEPQLAAGLGCSRAHLGMDSAPRPAVITLSFVHGEAPPQVNAPTRVFVLGTSFGEDIDKPVTSMKSQGKEATLLPCSPPASSTNDPSGSLSSPRSLPCYLGPSPLCPPNAKLG